MLKKTSVENVELKQNPRKAFKQIVKVISYHSIMLNVTD